MTDQNLVCDNGCRSIRSQGDRVKTVALARARGWHVFEGSTFGGQELVSVLCPVCAGMRRRLDPAPATLPGQEELF